MNLDEVRVKINDINDQMLELFKERMELSKDVAAAKKEMNKAIYDAKRERDILDKVTRDAGPDLDLYARRFFEALFSLSRTYQSEQFIPRIIEFHCKNRKKPLSNPLPCLLNEAAWLVLACSVAMHKWHVINYYHLAKFTT